MHLFYIRHGQSANNALYDTTGGDEGRVMDPELTPVGVDQAARVAESLCCGQPLLRTNGTGALGFGVTHLYTSLMVRSVHTGQAIAQALDLPLLGWTDLHEGGGIFLEDPVSGDFTGYPGSTRAELIARFPELVWPEDARQDGWWNRPFEPHAARRIRARRVLAELLRRHGDSDDRVAFVSHGGFFYRFICAVLDLPDPQEVWFHMNNTAITCFEFPEKRVVGIRYLNRLDHLPHEMMT
jgi:2,3-bisphosphoglycerate-dependent phosphoglycerate mutase